jgi:hypothetical protein
MRERIRYCLRFCFGSSERATATATILIAVVTTVYAIVSGLQWGAMRRANEINADSLYQIQRPFIFATGVDMQVAALPEGMIFDVNPNIQNGGNTPPKTLTIYANYFTPSDAIAPDYAFPDLDDVLVSSGAGGPKNVVKVPTKSFTVEQMNEFKNKVHRLYIYGHIEYDDTFRETPHHLTQFCFELAGIRGDLKTLLNGSPVSFNFPACRKHNCTDESCRAQK